MRPWSVGGSYDRPLPRRIAEESGLPRDRFGVRKVASSHSHLTEPSRFSARALSDYRHFVIERHAGIPSRTQHYWRARVRWRHYAWDIIRHDNRRYVHPNFLERRFPFALIVKSNRVPWDYMFTFQWTVASVRSRYATAAAVAR